MRYPQFSKMMDYSHYSQTSQMTKVTEPRKIIDFYILLCRLFTSFIRTNYAAADPSLKNQRSAGFYISCKNV